MKFVFAILLVLCFKAPVFAQTGNTNQSDSVFGHPEQMPEYPGGQSALAKAIASEFRYPKEAIKAKVEGRVYISFIVDTLGNVTNAQIEKGIGAGCDEEALRVINLLGRFTPAHQQGKAVAYKYIMPIKFKLQ